MKKYLATKFDQLHRHVFDKFYTQDHIYTKKDKWILWWYHFGFWIFPKWRESLPIEKKYIRYWVVAKLLKNQN